MASSSAERNLLFGILAMQMGFISPEALLAAFSAWVLDKSRPLDAILLEQRALAVEDHAVLDPMVRRHLEKHGGDPARGVAALSTIDPARSALEVIADVDIRDSLGSLRGATIDYCGNLDCPARIVGIRCVFPSLESGG